MERKFEGVVGTPVTPFSENNRFDRQTFERLVNFLVDNGINALAVPMHIGESLNMSAAERKELAELAVEVVGGRIPVIINVSLPGTDQVIDLARHSQEAGADGIVTITPYHWQPPADALLAHFTAVGSAIDIPFLVYNYPARLGVSVTPDIVAELINRLENFVGIKDASFNMEYFTEMCRVTSELRPGFSMFVGIEYMLPSMSVGGVGAFSACGAVAPKLVRDLYMACKEGEFELARSLQHRLSRLWNIIKPGYPAAIKAAMEIMGRPVGDTRLPLLPLGAEEKQRLRQDLEALGVLDEEPSGWKVTMTAPTLGS